MAGGESKEEDITEERKRDRNQSANYAVFTAEEAGCATSLGLGRGVDTTNPSPWLNYTVFTAEEAGRATSLGLGRGVNATNPSPWLNKSSFQVRQVTPSNTIVSDEGRVVQSYTYEVPSVQDMQVTLSASVPASHHVWAGVDAELSQRYRNTSSSQRVIGKKILTRSFSYRADHTEQKPRAESVFASPDPVLDAHARIVSGGRRRRSSTAERKTSIVCGSVSDASGPPGGSFEQFFSQWILDRLLEEEVEETDNDSAVEGMEGGVDVQRPHDSAVEGTDGSVDVQWPHDSAVEGTEGSVDVQRPHDAAQELATFCANWAREEMTLKQVIGQKCSEFVDHFCITHYVSSIELGAAKFQVMSEETYQKKKKKRAKTKSSLAVEEMEGIALESRSNFDGRRTKFLAVTEMGGFEATKGVTEEAVLGAKFHPISALVETRLVRNLLQKAIQRYINTRQHSRGQSVTC